MKVINLSFEALGGAAGVLAGHPTGTMAAGLRF
jgi:hypothetical protein